MILKQTESFSLNLYQKNAITDKSDNPVYRQPPIQYRYNEHRSQYAISWHILKEGKQSNKETLSSLLYHKKWAGQCIKILSDTYYHNKWAGQCIKCCQLYFFGQQEFTTRAHLVLQQPTSRDNHQNHVSY